MPSLSSHGLVAMSDSAKELLFRIDCKRGALAYSADGQERPLSKCDINNVKFIGGLWRVQDKFKHNIQCVRDKEFVLLEKINRIEKNKFEFYHAALVGTNCYGRFIVGGATHIVAKYETDKQTYWSYGSTIEQARAFLGNRLYDEYSDLIHSVACKNKLSHK